MHAVSAIPSWHALELSDGPGKVAVQMRPEELFSALGTEVSDFSALPPRSTRKSSSWECSDSMRALFPSVVASAAASLSSSDREPHTRRFVYQNAL